MKPQSYGAPMGAPAYGLPKAPVCLREAPIDSQGYAQDGSYWGKDLPLWHAYSDGYSKHVRAKSRKEAAQKLGILPLLAKPVVRKPIKPLMLELIPDYRSDRWGYAMSLLFDVSGELHWRRCPIPWQYSPGWSQDGRSEERYLRRMLARLSTPRLLELGRFLDRLCDLLRRAGRDY